MSKHTVILGIVLLVTLGVFNWYSSTAADEPTLAKHIQGGAVLLDVRTPGEFNAGNVQGSINIPVGLLSGRTNELDSTKTIVVYCQSGGRSARAKKILEKAGFKKVLDGKTWNKVNSIVKTPKKQ